MALMKILAGDHDGFHGVKICLRSLLIVRIVNGRMPDDWRSLYRRRSLLRPPVVGRNRRWDLPFHSLDVLDDRVLQSDITCRCLDRFISKWRRRKWRSYGRRRRSQPTEGGWAACRGWPCEACLLHWCQFFLWIGHVVSSKLMSRVFRYEQLNEAVEQFGREYSNSYSFCISYLTTQSLPCHMSCNTWSHVDNLAVEKNMKWCHFSLRRSTEGIRLPVGCWISN